MVENNPDLESARARARLISEHIRQRRDLHVRSLLEQFDGDIDYAGNLETLAIADEAWAYIQDAGIDPKLVFAHPTVLREHPETSLHYRGIATLSLKRVQALATSVSSWEGGQSNRKPSVSNCEKVARLYNAVISVVILGSDQWTLEISFRQMTDAGEWEIVSTIEIKSGTDPAGALERLGAIQKSFDATPVKSRNFAVLGVVTQEMRRRLNDLNFEKDFSLFQILNDEEAWEDFVQELFHYTLRVI